MLYSSLVSRIFAALCITAGVGCQALPAQSQPAPIKTPQSPILRVLQKKQSVRELKSSALPAVINLKVSLWSSAFYQLNCLSERSHCSGESFRLLWEQEGLKALLPQLTSEFLVLKRKYENQLSLTTSEAPLETHLPFRFEGVLFWDKIRQAALNSQDQQMLQQNLSLLMLPQDAEAMVRLLVPVVEKLTPWWQTEGFSLAQKTETAFAGALETPELSQLLANASAFYQADLSAESTLGFHFLSRPEVGDRSVNGEQIESQSVIEVREGVEPLSNLDVVIHELSHYFYRRQPAKEFAQVMSFFTEKQTVEAIGAHHLLNEVLATAIGNGQVNQLLRSPESYARFASRPLALYNDPWIDSVAKSLLPRLAVALKNKEKLVSSTFLEDYLEIAIQTVGKEGLGRPEILLRTMGVVAEPVFKKDVRNLQGLIRVGNARSVKDLSQGLGLFLRYPALSGVVFLNPEQAAQVANNTDWISEAHQVPFQREIEKGDAFIYGKRRNSQAYIYFIVLPEGADPTALFERLKAQTKSFTGPMDS